MQAAIISAKRDRAVDRCMVNVLAFPRAFVLAAASLTNADSGPKYGGKQKCRCGN